MKTDFHNLSVRAKSRTRQITLEKEIGLNENDNFICRFSTSLEVTANDKLYLFQKSNNKTNENYYHHTY